VLEKEDEIRTLREKLQREQMTKLETAKPTKYATMFILIVLVITIFITRDDSEIEGLKMEIAALQEVSETNHKLAIRIYNTSLKEKAKLVAANEATVAAVNIADFKRSITLTTTIN